MERLVTASLSEKARSRARILFIYVTGQGLSQLLGVSIGLLLLRWLSIDDYAEFSVAFGFQTTLSLLTDLGFAATIVALVGPRVDEPEVIGSYIRSGRWLRNVMLVVLTPVAAIVYAGIARQHHWRGLPSVLLFVSVIASIYFTGMMSYHGAPLLIKKRLAHYYRHQVTGAAFRIAACMALHFAGVLSAWSMSWINALGFLVIGVLNAREARQFIKLPPKPIAAVTRQMARYVMPNLPNLIFFALQGQITIFLISFFGKTRNIAEVGALTRLGQIFMMLHGFNTAVLEPYVARLPRERLLKTFLTVLAFASSICLAISLCGFLFPQVFLLLLGAKYSTLSHEVGFLVLGSCLTYLAYVTGTMCVARQWVYWITSWTQVLLLVGTQIAFLSFVTVDTTAHAIYFGVASNAAQLAAYLFNAGYGFSHGPRIGIAEAPARAATIQMKVSEEAGMGAVAQESSIE